MTQYLRNLMEELEKTEVDPTLEPTNEVKPGEAIVGEMSDDLKRMESLYVKVLTKDYALQMRALEIFRGVLAGTKSATQGAEEMAALNSEKRWIAEEAKALHTNFWMSIWTEHPELRGKTNIGFRRGWKIVLTNANVADETDPEESDYDDNEVRMPPPETELPANAAPDQPEGPNFFGLMN